MTTSPTSGPPEPSDEVRAYLDARPEPQRTTLAQLRADLFALLPDADEGMRYGMPALLVGGHAVAGYAGFARHCGYYPMSGSVIARAGDVLDAYETSTGGLRFAVGHRLPMPLLRTVLTLRLEEVGQPGLD